MPSSAGSEIDIANMALIMLGQQKITSLSSSNNRAVMANQRYADIRDSVLRAHPWNCAIKRDKLAKSAVVPDWGYTSTFSLPADFVRLISIEDPTQKYSIEAGNEGSSAANDAVVIVTDASEMNIRYVYQITDVGKMDHTLKHAIATRLAADLASVLTGDTSKEQFLMQKYESILLQATWEDSTEHNTTETIHGGLWLESRYDNAVSRDYPDLNSDGSLA